MGRDAKLLLYALCRAGDFGGDQKLSQAGNVDIQPPKAQNALRDPGSSKENLHRRRNPPPSHALETQNQLMKCIEMSRQRLRTFKEAPA